RGSLPAGPLRHGPRGDRRGAGDHRHAATRGGPRAAHPQYPVSGGGGGVGTVPGGDGRTDGLHAGERGARAGVRRRGEPGSAVTIAAAGVFSALGSAPSAARQETGKHCANYPCHSYQEKAVDYQQKERLEEGFVEQNHHPHEEDDEGEQRAKRDEPQDGHYQHDASALSPGYRLAIGGKRTGFDVLDQKQARPENRSAYGNGHHVDKDDQQDIHRGSPRRLTRRPAAGVALEAGNVPGRETNPQSRFFAPVAYSLISTTSQSCPLTLASAFR